MIKKILPKSKFTKNVWSLMTGSLLGQILLIISTPVLTRLFSPEEFGVFALFLALTVILGSIASGRYELAIMLPKNNKMALNIMMLGIFLSFLLFVMLTVIVLVFGEIILLHLRIREDYELLLYMVPLSVFMIGVFNVVNYMNIRLNNFNRISVVTLIKSAIMVSVQLFFGLLKLGGSLSLALGYMVAQIFSSMALLLSSISKIKKIITHRRLKVVATRYSGFPRYSSFAALIYSANAYLPIFLLSFFGFAIYVGFYVVIQKMLGSPINIISGAINNVLYSHLVLAKKNKTIGILLERYIIRFIYLSVGPGILIVLLSPFAFGFVFGDAWEKAGLIAAIIAPYFLLQFIFSPMSTVISVMEWQKHGLAYQLSTFFLGGISLTIGLYFSVIIGMLIFSATLVFLVASYRLYLLTKLDINIKRTILMLMFSFSIFSSLAFLIYNSIIYMDRFYVITFFIIYIILYGFFVVFFYKKEGSWFLIN